jgi:hypothetical protein
MRSLSVLPSLLLALAVPAQNPPIDLNLWTVEDLTGTGPWTIDAPYLRAESTNTTSNDCSVFYSDFDVVLLDVRMRVDALGGDDDLCGFVLGWRPGDGTSATADFLVVDWKRITQTYQNWGTANAGLALSRVTGALTRGYGNAPIDLWSHTLNCTELARSATYGTVGWDFETEYRFRVLYTPVSVDIWLDDVLEFSIAGNFTAGRFGCYNFSQSRTGFQFPLAGSFTSFGSSCAGSAGVPYLFSPAVPYLGENLPIITANVNPGAMPFLLVGLSRSTWNAVALPAALDPYGAPGCSLLVSNDLMLLTTNYNGTAYTTFRMPTVLPPSTVPLLFVQTMVIDLPANQLGLVLSNAAAIAIGVR